MGRLSRCDSTILVERALEDFQIHYRLLTIEQLSVWCANSAVLNSIQTSTLHGFPDAVDAF